MSECQIRITFDRGDRVYSGGDTASGKVQLPIDLQTQSNVVKLTQHRRTHGRGGLSSGRPEEFVLAEPRPSYC